MKLSAYHKNIGDDVDLAMPSTAYGYDKVYASKIFSYTEMPNLPFNTILGGSGVDINAVLPLGIDNLCPDYDLYNMNYSLGFFTRGCIRSCDWCIVPQKEGKIQPYAKINDFIRHKYALLMDNNVLASLHGIEQIEALTKLNIRVDFNQGLDARLIDFNMAKLLAKIKWWKPIRLACDTQSSKKVIEIAVALLRQAGATPKRYFVYCLIKDDIDEALDRISYLQCLGLDVFAQPYRSLQGNTVSHVAKELASWCNQAKMRKTLTFNQFYSYRNKDEAE
jgi:hypothetical protein